MENYIWVTTQIKGIHNWNEAPKEVEYLKFPHRHIFHFKIFIEVRHNEREIEFHLFKKFIEKCIGTDFFKNVGMSCETMADLLNGKIKLKYPDRKLIIDISEDGENGVRKTY